MSFIPLFAVEIGKIPNPLVQAFIKATLAHARTGGSVSMIVAELGVTRQYLAELLRLLGFQQPHRYVSLARLLGAAEHLETSRVPLEVVAVALKFGSAPDLYKMFKRYTGRSVGTLRDQGIFAYMIEQYRTAIVVSHPTPPPADY